MRIIIILLASVLLLSSCSVEKRLYSSGYHIEWHTHKTKQIKQDKVPTKVLVRLPVDQPNPELVSFEKTKITAIRKPNPPTPLSNDLMASTNQVGGSSLLFSLRNSIPLNFSNLAKPNRKDANTKSSKKERYKLTKEDKVVLFMAGLLILIIIGFIVYRSISTMSFGGTLIWI